MFFNQYENLRSVDFNTIVPRVTPPVILLPAVMGNENRAQSYGFECFADYRITPRWLLHGGYSFLVMTGSSELDAIDPRDQIYLRSAWDLGCRWQLDLMWRYVSSLTSQDLVEKERHDSQLQRHGRATGLAGPTRTGTGRGRASPAAGLALRVSVKILSWGPMNTAVQSEVYGMVTWRY